MNGKTKAELNSILGSLRLIAARVDELMGAVENAAPVGLIPGQRRQVDIIVAVVAEKMGVPVKQIYSRDRHEKIARARQLAMTLVHAEMKLSFNQVGKLFRRDHGTADSAVKAIENLVQTNYTFGRIVAGITTDVRAALSLSAPELTDAGSTAAIPPAPETHKTARASARTLSTEALPPVGLPARRDCELRTVD